MLYSVFSCIAYILGIVWELNLRFVGLVPIFLFLIVCMLIKIIFRRNIKAFLFVLIIFFLLGFFNTYIKEFKFKNTYNEGLVYMQGEVTKLLSYGSAYNKYLFKDEYNHKFLLFVSNKIALNKNTVIFIKGNLEFPTDARNFNCFDNQNYYYSQNIYGCIKVNNNQDLEIIKSNFNLFSKIRDAIFNVLSELFPKDAFGLLLRNVNR